MTTIEPFEEELGWTFNFIGPDGEERLEVPDFELRTYMVNVTGLTMFGHALLCVGNFDLQKYYFHVGGPGRLFPRWMDEAGYTRYLKENNKREVWRVHIPDINKPIATRRELKKQLNEKWTWGVLAHNCVGFAETVIQAGGSKAGLIFNTPATSENEARAFENLPMERPKDLTWGRRK
ncbi:MAG: hypothetical protein ACRESZ_07805 [Methylococcales bacterium]